jgi:hypothetical protein
MLLYEKFYRWFTNLTKSSGRAGDQSSMQLAKPA